MSGGARANRGGRAQAAGVRSRETDRTPPGPLSPDRAKTLAARAFDDAIEALGLSNEVVGKALGVGEAVIRRMRTSVRPITTARVLRLPAALRVEYLARLGAAAEAPPCAPTRAAQGLAVLAAAGEVSHAIADALRDGVITEAELDAAAPALARLRRMVDALSAPGGDA